MHPVDWTIPQAIHWLFSVPYLGFALLIVLGLWALVRALTVIHFLDSLVGR